MITAILIGIVVMVLNVLDSVTTHIAFKQYPDETLHGEGNPIMRALMLKNKWLSEMVKQGVVLAIVIYSVMTIDIGALRLFSIILGLVVVNNSWVVASRAIAKRKVFSPFERLRLFLHFPDNKYYYIVAVAILIGLSYLINYIVW